MKLIVFATYPEAAATVEALGAHKVDESCYHFKGGEIAICGVGIHCAIATVCTRGEPFNEIWNLGCAGALHTLPLLKLVSICQVGKYLPPLQLDAHALTLRKELFPSIPLEGTHALLSSDFPIHTKEHRQEGYDLIDMEGYGVAWAANHLHKPCRIWKVTSDFASPGGVALIRKNKQHISQQLAQKVIHESCYHP